MDSFKELTTLEKFAAFLSGVMPVMLAALVLLSVLSGLPWFITRSLIFMVVMGILFAGAAIFGILHKKPYFAKIVCFGILGLIVGAITISIYSLFKKVNFHEYVRFMFEGIVWEEKTIPEEKIPVAVVILVLMYLVMPLMTAPVLMAYYCKAQKNYNNVDSD